MVENKDENKYTSLKNIDEKDVSILRELIKDPRKSDNKISRITKIPLKTVNRKRQKLEEKGVIFYFTAINNLETGSGIFGAIQFCTIYFNYGISRQQVLDIISRQEVFKDPILKKHILLDWIGEKDAKVTYQCILVSRVESDIIEIINVEIVPKFTKVLGDSCIKSIEQIPNIGLLRTMHNYMPFINMEKGKLKKSVADSEIFVT